MKTKLSLIIIGGLLLFAQSAMAADPTLTVSASIPAASALQLTVTTYNAVSKAVVGTPSTSATTIPFGQLTLTTTGNNIYAPTNYYAVSIGTIGGAGTPIVNVTYAEGTGAACPNIAAGLSATLGCLGTKTTATFVTANPTTNVEVVSSLGKKRLIDLTGTAGQLSTIPTGQYEKIYLGVWGGDTTAPADPTNGQPFTNGDAPGTYQGILTFTAVTL